jgi:hypothetical protein
MSTSLWRLTTGNLEIVLACVTKHSAHELERGGCLHRVARAYSRGRSTSSLNPKTCKKPGRRSQ